MFHKFLTSNTREPDMQDLSISISLEILSNTPLKMQSWESISF